MLRPYNQVIKAGEEVPFSFNGNYVRMISSLVTITFFTDNGDEFELAAGEEAELENFKILRVRHASGVDQAISFYIGKGKVKVGSAKVGGIVAVSNFPAFPAGFNINNFAADYIQYGAAFSSNALLGANGNVNIFTPAANVNGAILKAASFNTYNAGGAGNSSVGFIAHTSAPATIAAGEVLLAPAGGSIVNAGAYMHGNELNKEIYIPAGKGLYFLSTIAETYSMKKALYTLL